MIHYHATRNNRVEVECNGDIAVTRFDDGTAQVIRLSDDYGQRTPGENFRPDDYTPVPLGECSGILIVMTDAKSARTIEHIARLAAEKLEAMQHCPSQIQD